MMVGQKWWWEAGGWRGVGGFVPGDVPQVMDDR